MAGISQNLRVLIAVSVAAMALCTVQASHYGNADIVLTSYLLEPTGSEERSATLVEAVPGFPEETEFGKTRVFDAPVFLEPDSSLAKFASYQGFLIFSSTTDRSITITAAYIFVNSTDYPAGTRLHIRGNFETQVLEDGGSADLSIVGGTGPLLRAGGYATYELVPDVGAPGELFFRIILHVFLPKESLYGSVK